MNNRTSFALLAILTAVGTLTMSSAYAEHHESGEYMEDHPDVPAAYQYSEKEAREAAAIELLKDTPVNVWTDKTTYGHDDMIMVSGAVANVDSGFPVTITVVSPLNSIVSIDQLTVSSDKSFETSFNTASALWKYDGTYTIRANYGSAETNTKVELTGGLTWTPSYSTPEQPAKQCGANELSASGQCVPYNISGGMVTGASINTDDNSIVINISADDDGTLVVNPSTTVLDGAFMVLVDGEEWDDVEIVANKVTVMFPAGTEEIEVIGTFVIPEFGTITAMILAVAIISIIAISARSRLSIMPRY